MPLHIDRTMIEARTQAHEHVHDRVARDARAASHAAAAPPVPGTPQAGAVLDAGLVHAVRAAAGSDVADVDAAERLVASLRSDPSALSRLHDRVSPDRVHALVADA